MADPVYI